jgi:hypothetical protein
MVATLFWLFRLMIAVFVLSLISVGVSVALLASARAAETVCGELACVARASSDVHWPRTVVGRPPGQPSLPW